MQIGTWFGKPHELSPIQCARFGWTNADTDTLVCSYCGEILCGRLPMEQDACKCVLLTFLLFEIIFI